MDRREARKEAMLHPFGKKEGFVIIKLTDGSVSWEFRGKPLPNGARIVEEWYWHSGWQSKIVEFDEFDRNYTMQFLDTDALFAIDWTKLSFPGFAWNEDDLKYFPYRLCALTSPDLGIWSNASAALDALVDDCIISNLTTQALPFLLQLVRNPTTPYRTLLLEYIWRIVGATRYQSESGSHLSSYDCLKSPEPDELVVLEKIHLLIAEFCPVFIELLMHNEAGTRERASHILAHFPEQIAAIWPPFEQAFLQEQDELLKATFLEDLSLLAKGGTETFISWFEHIWLTHPSELVRFVATIRLPHLTKQNTSPELVASLITLLETEPERLRHQYTALKGGMNSDYFYYDLLSALQVCEPTLRKAALPALLRQFHRQTQIYHKKSLAVEIAKALLDSAFPQTDDTIPPGSFDAEQLQVIAAICAYDEIWGQWLWDKHLRDHGLPDQRETLCTLEA